MSGEKTRRILIVDDNEDMRTILACQVRNITEAEPVLAANAKEAFHLVKESEKEGKPFSLILMDIKMPDINGVEAAKTLREVGFKGVIAACTAASTGTGRRESMEAGIDAYFDKRYLKKETIVALLQTKHSES